MSYSEFSAATVGGFAPWKTLDCADLTGLTVLKCRNLELEQQSQTVCKTYNVFFKDLDGAFASRSC